VGTWVLRVVSGRARCHGASGSKVNLRAMDGSVSRVRKASTMPRHSFWEGPSCSLSSEDRPQGRFSSFSGAYVASVTKRAREAQMSTEAGRMAARAPHALGTGSSE